MTNCPNCNAEVEEGKDVCTSCNQPMNASEETTQPTAETTEATSEESTEGQADA